MMSDPLVSCVMVTTGRVPLVERSLRCFLNQTYKLKELIVLSQGCDQDNQRLEELLKPYEEVQFVRCSRSLSLGAMRNLSIELTTGDLICQWDDDDLYHPMRIQNQLRLLSGHGIAATAYQQHLKYFADRKELYWIDWFGMPREFERYLCGTVMFHKKIFHHYNNLLYPDQPREEDLSVLHKLMAYGKIAPVVQGCQYIYVYHGNNTYWREHHSLVLEKKVFSKKELLTRKHEIVSTLESVGMTDSLTVRSLHEEAFEYRPESQK